MHINLIFIFVCCLALAFLSFRKEKQMHFVPVDEVNIRHEYMYFIMLFAVLLIFVGLRCEYNDTITYIGGYNHDPDIANLKAFFSRKSFRIGSNPGYRFTAALMNSLGMNSKLYIFSFSLFYWSVFLWISRKYSPNIVVTVFILFTLGAVMFSCAALKQVSATAIAMIATEFAFKKKWKHFYAILFIAILFHPYVILYMAVPYLYGKRPWGKETLAIVVIFAIAGLLFEKVAGIMENFNQGIGDRYTASQIIHTRGMNPLRFVAQIMPLFFSYKYRNTLYKKENVVINLFGYLHILSCCFYFLALFGAPILIGRLPAYFNIIAAIHISYLYEQFKHIKAAPRWVIPIACVGYVYYFIYEEFLNRNFYARYAAVSFGDFFYSLFSWIWQLV